MSDELPDDAPYTITWGHYKDMESKIKVATEMIKKKITPNNTANILEPKVSDPIYFTGDKIQLANFLSQCQMVFESQPLRYPNEYTKVLYTCTYLRDEAFTWIQPYIAATEKPKFMQSFTALSQELECTFGDPNRIATADRELRKLYQKDSVSIYTSQFTRLASQLNWGEEALYGQYHLGLKSIIKDRLINYPKTNSLSQLITLAKDIDYRLIERNEEKNNYYSHNYNNYNYPSYNLKQQFRPINHDPNAMEIDGIVPKRSTLSPEEYQRRINNNLCLYCGGSNHIRNNCLIRLANKQRNNKNISAIYSDSQNQGKASTQSQ